MQNKNRYIRNSLALATCSLLGTQSATVEAEEESDWRFDLALMSYSESGGRVSALEPLIRARKDLGDDEYFTIKFVSDSLTGATPSGAMPSSQVQTLTSASGGGAIVSVSAGEIPLDDNFKDSRWQLSLEWEKPITRLTKTIYTSNYSKENDFTSIGASATVLFDTNQRNTTFIAGIAYEHSTIEPIGDVPQELSDFAGTANRRANSEDRTQIDLLLGLTQILSRQTIMQFNISLSESDGYHTDPYKIVTVINDASPVNSGDPVIGDPIRQIFENRPDSKSRQSFFWKTKHHFEKNIADVSYRYLTDDWEISSHTLNLRYTIMFETPTGPLRGGYIQPHIRFYQQDAAKFYRTNIPLSEALPSYISADYRLGDMSGTTFGFKISTPLDNDRNIAFRLERISQSGDPSPGSKLGILSNLSIVPKTKATIIQVHYSF